MSWPFYAHGSTTVTVRRATVADAGTVARIYLDCWRHNYAGILPQDYLNRLSHAHFENHWRRTFAARGWAFLAEFEGETVGLASGGRSRIPQLASGELYILYVDPRFQRRGIGRALFDACHYEFARSRHVSVLARVFATNHAARVCFERLGGRLAEERTVEILGVPVREVVYVWSD